MRTPLVIVAGAAILAGCIPPAPAAPRVQPAPEAPSAAASGEREILVPQTGAPKDSASRRAEQGVSASELSQRVTEVFGALPDADSVAADPNAEGDAPSWDIAVTPYETHARVEHFVRHFTGPARARVEERLGRGTRYEGMIREKLRAGGLPEDMYYLAFVESGYDPHAYSRAAAVGMWQFMASTARGMGLRVDWWVDERRDPVRATDAAVRFLRSLDNQFGSMYLAAAAYNGGPGRVARGLTRFADDLESAEGEDRFFGLAEQDFLPKETKDYVPQIIAAALVGKDPARYGLQVTPREPFAYDSVAVPALTSIPAIARAAGTDVATLRDLNPHFLRGVTPPDRQSTVRIPLGSRARFDSAFAALSPAERSGARKGKVARLSNINRLAAQLETTPRAIEAFNPNLRRTRARNIIAGQTVLVPDADVLAAALNVPDPAIERYGSSKASGTTRFHVVKRGETLSHIAVKYGTSVKSLMALNRLKKPMIFAGQELVVKGTAKAAPAKKPTAKKPTAKKPTTKKPAKKTTGATSTKK